MIVRSRLAMSVFGTILGMKPSGVAFYPFIFIDPEVKITDELVNHERIHLRQQLELLVIPFYIWYMVEFFRKGYRNISFEREAYGNEKDLGYLGKRKPFSFWRYR